MKKLTRVLGALGLIAFFSIGAIPKSKGSSMVTPQSMYLAADGRLYVSDPGAGIHIYTTSETSAPLYMATIPLMGNTGVAVRDSIIYADAYGAILALRLHADYSADTAAVIRQSYYYYDDYYYEDSHRGWGCGGGVDYAESPVSGGAGSSYAVFAIIDTFLYYVDGYNLLTMSIALPQSPRQIGTTNLSWDIETLFPTENYLFVGGSSGMYILNRRPNPASPVLITTFTHASACDPVVVRDTIAYITLRTGTTCWGTTNEILTVSIADPSSPVLLDQIVPTKPPFGLAVRDTFLFVGNERLGMDLYSVARPDSISLAVSWTAPPAVDFIWSDDKLFVMGTGGISAYNVTDPRVPVALGRIQ